MGDRVTALAAPKRAWPVFARLRHHAEPRPEVTFTAMDDHEAAGRPSDLDVHGTIERIYATVLDPTGWAEVVRDLSRIFGGAPVAFGFLAGPERSDARRYACGVPDDSLRELLHRLAQDTPWTERHMIALSD